jgi:hypothetical protein
MPHWNNQPWQRNLSKIASGKPGAVHLTPADVYFGRGQTILLERERIKRRTIQQRRLMHHQNAA